MKDKDIPLTTDKFYPDFPSDYVPCFIQVRDRVGVLLEIKNMEVLVMNSRPENYVPNIICWYFDGIGEENIAYSHTLNKVLIDRISQVKAIKQISNLIN